MAKVLIANDIHIIDGIYNEITLQWFDKVFEYITKNEIKYFIIAGDLFEKASRIKNEVFLPLFFRLMRFHSAGIKMWFVLGNHDIYNNDNDSLVEAFAPFGEVVKNYKQIVIDGETIDLLAYTKEEEDIPDTNNILITHLAIADFQFDNKYNANEKMAFPRNLFKKFKLVITGHFHKYQHKGNIVYGGSPFQLGFEEMGCEKGFLVLDTKTITVEFVKNLFSPTYMEIDLDKITSIDDFSELDVKNKFVGVIMREKVDNFIKLKHVLYEKGALDITPKYENEKNDILTSDEKPVEFNKNVDDMFLEFIKNNIKLEGIDNNRLVDIFEEIKEEIEA